MRYLNPSTRKKINEIVNKINQKELVTLSERIFLSKYKNKYPFINSLIKEKLLKFP
tara:strand:- start:70 stop:237 length:168 start_codon:yes stop_codon:yes gene_type:complete